MSASTPRPRRASGSAASTIRSTCRCARARRTMRDLSAASRPTRTRRCGTTRSACSGQRGGLSFTAAAFYTDISNLQVTADAGSCSSRVVFNVPEAHTMGVEAELSARAGRGPRPVAHRQLRRGRVRLDRDRRTAARSSPASARATACRRCRSSRSSASASYTFPVGDGGRGLCRRLLPACRQPLHPAGRPGEQSAHLRLTACRSAARRPTRRRSLDLKLPAYNYVNLSAGIDWDNGLGVMVYVNNLFDENALLSFDRERGGRARLGFNVGQPRVDRHHRPQALRQLTPARPTDDAISRRSLLLSGAAARRRPRPLPESAAAPSRRAAAAGTWSWSAPACSAPGPRRSCWRPGKSVLLLDAWGPAHARASSGGESRMTRGAYGADEVYTRMAWTRCAEWRALSAAPGLPIFHETGVLFFSPRSTPISRADDAGPPPARPADRAARRRGAAAALPADRFHRHRGRPLRAALRRADGAARGADPGRRVRPRRRRISPGGGAAAGRRARSRDVDPSPRPASMHRGRTLRLRLRALARPAVPGPARPRASSRPGRRCSSSRPRPATRASQPGRLPGWADFNGGDIYYGFPDLEGRGFKIAHDAHGAADGSRTPATAPSRRRRWPTCAPSWPAASRARRPAAERGARLPV